MCALCFVDDVNDRLYFPQVKITDPKETHEETKNMLNALKVFYLTNKKNSLYKRPLSYIYIFIVFILLTIHNHNLS